MVTAKGEAGTQQRGLGDMAGYVEKTLALEEQIIHRANFNWTYSFFPVMWFSIGAGALALIAYAQFVGGVSFEDLEVGWWSAGIGAAAGSLILINHLILLVTTEIVVTTFRFVYKTGLISRNTQEVSLGKIEEITLRQTIWGRLLGFGHLVLRGTGVGVIELPALDNPIELRRIIENARSSLRHGTGKHDEDNGE